MSKDRDPEKPHEKQYDEAAQGHCGSASPDTPSQQHPPPQQQSVQLDPAWGDPDKRPPGENALHAISYPRLSPEDLPVEAEPVPTMVPDPFDPSKMLDLSAADMPAFNLVDGTVTFVTDSDMPFVLYKGYNPNTWFYAPRWGRIAKNPNGEPAFMVTKKVRNNPDGSKTTLGGILSFMVELVVELPGDAEQQKWTNLIRTMHHIEPTGGRFNFQPLRLNPGRMNVSGLDMYARPGQRLKDIEVGASSSIAFAIELTPDGADHFAAMLGATPSPFPPQVAIMFDFRYQYLIPQCRIQAHGYKKKCYDYFSWNAKARASYFGLVNGAFEYQSVRADLRQQQAFDVSVIGQPPAGVELSKLLDSVFDQFVKLEVGQWIQADPKPVEASAPGGFFGGVSVAMKSVSLSDTAQFDQTMQFAGISEGLHQVSFNFEQQLGTFDPHKHLFIEEDDIKLPFKVLLSNSPLIKRILPSASYTTSTGPRSVQCNAVTGDGGFSEGVIQFTWPQQPTSADLDLLVDFVSPYIGYKYDQTLPVSKNGAAFAYYPDAYVQRMHAIFTDPVYAVDLRSRALFTWEWTPPAGSGPPRPRVAGNFLVGPDPNGNTFNLPTYDIIFPYNPSDWTGESTPKIQYKLQGLTGEWKNRTSSGTITLGVTALGISFDGSTAVGDSLAGPAAAENAEHDPDYRQRLTAMFGPPPSKGGAYSSSGGEGHAPGSGFIPPDHLGHPGIEVGEVPPFKLGYKPDVQGGEPSLYERELIAQVHAQHATAESRAAAAAHPADYDLRNVYGYNYITPVRNQGNCGSCVAFGVTAAVEGSLQVRRNDPYLNPDFSEAHLFYCHGVAQGRSCGNAGEANGGWWPSGALDQWYWNGVADEGCFPYNYPASPAYPTLPCTACWDAQSRATKISTYYVLSNPDDMKSWISSGWGPLAACFSIYQEFYNFFQTNTSPSAIYRKSNSPGTLYGGHCICVVGYSDYDQAWICKNSWSTAWAASGFFKIGYGQAGIDAYMWGADIS
ncbi:C1 family peptidase [Streptomyces lydicus]